MPFSLRQVLQHVVRALPIVGRITQERDELRKRVDQLWQVPGHFYSPIPDLAEVKRREAAIFATGPMLGVDLNEAAQLTMLDRLATVASDHGFTNELGGGKRYHFDNPAFGTIDALVWAALLRTVRPTRVIEVGSGYSTAVLLDTNECHLAGAVDVTLIEPFPALVKTVLRPDDRVRLIAAALQDVPVDVFDQLQRDDVLFIDSTHVSKTGSDVNQALFHILPRLAPGVYIHIHDILDGFEYPREWVYQGRAWNEAYVVRAFLQYNTAFEIVLWAPWLARVHPTAVRRAFPAVASDAIAGAASLWLRKV